MSDTRQPPADPPAEVRPLIDLLNSRQMEWRADLLDSPETTADLLRDSTLGPARPPLDPATLSMLRTVRGALVQLVRASADPSTPGHDQPWGVIDDITRQMHVTVRFRADAEGPSSELKPALDATPSEAVMVRLLTGLHNAVQRGSLRRVRLCANPACEVAFYDRTRSRTQRWHSYSICGNRSNVTAYRAKIQKP